ncbi:MAG TPA: alpha-L-arabinofuranosidase C-terminal domain-containing protein, partial [Erythrobacter sp.]|nr:alpha-L-arabinofuranosidase C-terminal domain-containing protein [Erythrobacter sp.]
NLHPHNSRQIVLDLGALKVRAAKGQVLTGPNVNSLNTFDAPDTVVPRPIMGRIKGSRVTVELPPKSVAVLALD